MSEKDRTKCVDKKTIFGAPVVCADDTVMAVMPGVEYGSFTHYIKTIKSGGTKR